MLTETNLGEALVSVPATSTALLETPTGFGDKLDYSLGCRIQNMFTKNLLSRECALAV